MKIVSIKYKNGVIIGDNKERIPFSFIVENKGKVEKWTFLIIDTYDDCHPVYIEAEINNFEYNRWDYLEEYYSEKEWDGYKFHHINQLIELVTEHICEQTENCVMDSFEREKKCLEKERKILEEDKRDLERDKKIESLKKEIENSRYLLDICRDLNQKYKLAENN